MKYLLIIVSFIIFTVAINACTSAESTNKPVEESEENSNKITEISDLSIYNLPSTWTTQDNEQIELIDLNGNVLVMVMIYTSCKAACPRLVADMRNIDKAIPEENKEKLKLIFVSIDPETDTPERLKNFSIENQLDEERWIFLRSNEESTREFAAVLAVNYKQISPIDFSHSNIISVFNEKGELVHQREGLGVDNEDTIKTIIALTTSLQ